MKKQLLTFALVPAIAFGAVSIPPPQQAYASTAGQIVSSVSFRQSLDVNSEGIGLTLPSDSRGQGSYVKAKGNIKTNWRDLQPGDLMFSWIIKELHVGIYLGDGKILHTYSVARGGVRIDSIAGKHREYRFLFGGSAM